MVADRFLVQLVFLAGMSLLVCLVGQRHRERCRGRCLSAPGPAPAPPCAAPAAAGPARRPGTWPSPGNRSHSEGRRAAAQGVGPWTWDMGRGRRLEGRHLPRGLQFTFPRSALPEPTSRGRQMLTCTLLGGTCLETSGPRADLAVLSAACGLAPAGRSAQGASSRPRRGGPARDLLAAGPRQ